MHEPSRGKKRRRTELTINYCRNASSVTLKKSVVVRLLESPLCRVHTYLHFAASSLALVYGCFNAYSTFFLVSLLLVRFLSRIFYFYLFLTLPVHHAYLLLSCPVRVCSLSVYSSEPRHWSINDRSLHKTFCTLYSTASVVSHTSSDSFSDPVYRATAHPTIEKRSFTSEQ